MNTLACIPDPNPNARGGLVERPSGYLCLYIAVLVVAVTIINGIVRYFTQPKE